MGATGKFISILVSELPFDIGGTCGGQMVQRCNAETGGASESQNNFAENLAADLQLAIIKAVEPLRIYVLKCCCLIFNGSTKQKAANHQKRPD